MLTFTREKICTLVDLKELCYEVSGNILNCKNKTLQKVARNKTKSLSRFNMGRRICVVKCCKNLIFLKMEQYSPVC